MAQQRILAADFLRMMRAGAKKLTQNVPTVNALNVFPVPDGDTGTNMNLTLTSGVGEMEKQVSVETVGKLAEALSRGLLMGARGNSGVILSQLFRGFARAVADKESITTRQLADAFRRGVETAYKAVIKPVEGTILTVAREAAEAGYNRAMTTEDPAQVMEAVLEEARRTLARTPEMLPVLKQTGVVDAGGQGLVFIYEGMLSALRGEEELLPVSELPDLERLADVAHENAQAKLDPSQIEHGYCTEFIINLKTVRRPTEKFDEALFRKEMERFGDSLLVVADDELVKVHIHAEYPGDALNHAMRYGDLTRIKIDNMREQYDRVTSGHGAKVEPAGQEEAPVKEKKRYGIVAVAAGEGVADIFRSLGADVVIGGGQTMNPSTRDLVQAMEQVHAEHIFILPNNKNIVLAAEQAGQVMNVPVTVVPTRSVPQGLSALFRFDAEAGPEENRQAMLEACAQVKTGEVTYAVRDTVLNGLEIKAGDFLGIAEGKIRVTGKEKNRTAEELLDHLVQGGTDMVTILYGQDVTEAEAKELVQSLESKYPEIEWEVHAGGQPLYYYLFAVE